MALPKWVPSGPDILREAVIVMAGALLATIIVKKVFPQEWQDLFSLGPTQKP